MRVKTAAILVIGNEILSGRTQDTNTNTIAKALCEKGITLIEARVISDDTPVIIRHIHALQAQVDIILTTGGIGPTHDDKTAEAVALAHDTVLELNTQAYDILVKHYKSESEINDGRKKMAMIPRGALLIDNPISAAPGFHIGKTYVMAGVPKIMAAMLENVLITLEDGVKIQSQTITCQQAESIMAPVLAQIQTQFEDVDIGSYPTMSIGRVEVSVVLRSPDKNRLKLASDALCSALDQQNIAYAL